MTAPSTNTTPSTEPRQSKVGWFLLVVMIFSISMGVYSYIGLKNSAAEISDALVKINKEGESISGIQCVEKVRKWAKKCKSLKVLCEGWVVQMTEACLEAQCRTKEVNTSKACTKVHQLRKAECSSIKLSISSAHFSFAQCKPFKIRNRSIKKICAKSYGTFWKHCRYLGRLKKAQKKTNEKKGHPAKRP